VEKKKRKEEAVVHRKRSSRIAIKESEKEQELLAAKKRAEEDEKMSRARRAEARRQKEEADRIKRENAREQRRKEREAKQAGGPEADTRYGYFPHTVYSKRLTSANTPVDVVSQEPSSSSLPPGQMGKFPTLAVPVPVNGSGAASSGSRTPAEDWELDCEVCGRQGINRVCVFVTSYSSRFTSCNNFRMTAFPSCVVVDV
jgi:septal ring factor EnvC (AmiA/AmiB activator)